MKRGRKPIDVSCPKGYPFRLYEAGEQYIVASSKEDVKRKAKNKKIKLANVTELISANGHLKTNEILKQFGDQWVCKDGHIFYQS